MKNYSLLCTAEKEVYFTFYMVLFVLTDTTILEVVVAFRMLNYLYAWDVVQQNLKCKE